MRVNLWTLTTEINIFMTVFFKPQKPLKVLKNVNFMSFKSSVFLNILMK